MITAATEQMPNQSGKVARGLSSIGAEIVKTANKSGELKYQVDGVTKSLSLFDEQGEMLNTFTVLSKIKEDWDNMSTAEQSSLALTLGMKTQVATLTAEMNNFDSAIEASGVAMVSFGSASQENQKRADSWQVALQNLNREFTTFSASGGQLKTVLSIFVNLGSGILKFVNDSKALEVAIGAVGAVLVVKLIPNLVKTVTAVGNDVASFVQLAVESKSVSAALEATSISATGAQLALGGLFTVLTVGILAWNAYQSAQEQARLNAISALDTFAQTENQIAEAMINVKAESTSKEQLIAVMKTLDSSYDSEAGKLKDVNGLRDEAIKKLDEESKKKAQQVLDETGSEYYKSKKFLSSSYEANMGGRTIDYDTPAKAVENLEEKIRELKATKKDDSELTWAESNQLKNYERELSKVQNRINDSNNIITKYDDAQKLATETQSDLNEETSNSVGKMSTYAKAVKEYGEGSEKVQSVIDEMAKSVGISSDKFQEQADAMGMELDQYQAYEENTNQIIDLLNTDFASAVEGAINDVDNFGTEGSQAFQKVVSAIPSYKQSIIDNFSAIEAYYKEMNENNGQISEETSKKIQDAYSKNPELFNKMLSDYKEKGSAALNEYAQDVVDKESEVIDAIMNGNQKSAESFNDIQKAGQETGSAIAQNMNTAKVGVTNLGIAVDGVINKFKQLETASALGSVSSSYSSGGHQSVVEKKSSGGEIDKDGAYLVGESPTEELVIGRDKADKGFSTGEVVTLHKGDQVINHKDTEKILGRRANGTSSSYWTTEKTSSRQVARIVSSDEVNRIIKEVGDNVEKTSEKAQKSVSKSAKKAESDTKKSAEESAKATEDAAKKASEAWKDAYDKEKDALDHSLAMDEINETEYYKKLGDLNKKYFGESTQYHEDYLKEYQKNEEEIYKWEKEQKKEQLEQQKENYETAIGFIRDELETMKSDLQDEEDEELDNIQERIDAINDEKDAYDDAQQVKIDALNKEKDAFDETTNAEISALEDKKDAESDEWQAKLDALNNTNDALEKQKKLQEYFESLAKAKATKVKIFKDGKFVYSTDMSAVDEAQSALDEYNEELKQEQQQKILEDAKNAAEKNYTDQIDNLKTYLNDVDKNYDNQVKILESATDAKDKQYQKQLDDLDDYKNSVQDDYEEQIDDMSSYIDSFDDLVNEYQNQQAKMIADMLAGTDTENSQWLLRLDNLKEFVSGYNDTLAQLDTTKSSELMMPNGESLLDLTNAVNVTGTSSTSSSSSPSSVKVIGPAADIGRTNSTKAKSSSLTGSSGGIGPAYTKDFIASHSSGISSVNGNEMALVGDSPHSELVIGSKLNGVPMRLSSGSGVVNAESTSTLAGLFNTLGSVISSGGNLSSSNSSNSNSITIGNITLPQVKNGEDFVNYLKNFNMTQFAYSH